MEPFCPKLELMAVFEDAAGFPGNARGLMAAAGHCPSPACRFYSPACAASCAQAAASGVLADVLPFPAPRPGSRRGGGVAPLIALAPASRPAGPIALDALRTAGDRLGHLLGCWERLPRDPVAQLADIDPVELVELGLLGYIHLIDVTAPEPEGFEIRLWGRRLPIHGCTDFAGRRLIELPSRRIAEALMDQALAARELGAPVAVAGDETRLMLPLSASGTAIDHLLVGVRPGRAGGHGAPCGLLHATKS